MLSLIAARIATSRNELGLLYALGATPNEIRLLVASEASCFAAIGVAAGAALGVVVGPIASDLLGESVGWVIEPHLPWGVVGSVAIAAFGSAVFASILPALAIRTGPSLPPTIS
jgi:putative ABC transport system permease protein